MRRLFFANAELFHDRVLDAVAASPTPVRWLVVAAEPVTSVDVTSADMLAELDETLHAAGIELCVAEMKDPVKDKLKRFGLFARLGETAFFPTIGAAVSSYLETHPVDWVDWEDAGSLSGEVKSSGAPRIGVSIGFAPELSVMTTRILYSPDQPNVKSIAVVRKASRLRMQQRLRFDAATRIGDLDRHRGVPDGGPALFRSASVTSRCCEPDGGFGGCISRWPSARNAASAGMTPKLTTTPATDLTCCAAAGVEATTIASRIAVK